MKPKAVIVWLLFSLGGIAGAANSNSYESGICIFALHNYKLAPHVERAIVFGVSRILDTYKDTFGFSFPDNFKMKVVIFGDEDDFLKYQKKQLGLVISETGYCSGRHLETVVLQRKNTKKTEDAKEMVAVVFHEANHLILMHCVPRCPMWANEGLSEYFEGLNVFGENRRVYLEESRSKWCKYWVKKGFPIELDKYLSLSYDDWMKFRNKDGNAAYTIGYSLVYFMMSRSDTEGILKELLWGFKRTGDDTDSIKIINEHYPGGLEKLERNWREWIPKARSYRPLRALREEAEKAKEDSPVEEPNEN
ncbi:MAG: DUF1570 domain-containing protein [Phycisphaerae bacterium]|nr:DUF1570 domain-containing protein [Phycisphaerae bacterium]